MKKVAVIMGSDSDLPVVGKAIDKLKSFGVPVEAHVMSAHRTPAAAAAFASSAAREGFGVIIAAAGKAAHLAGVLAAHTVLPVIGIPVKSSTLDGLDALRHPGGHGGYRRGGKRGDSGGADAGAGRCGAADQAAGNEGIDGPRGTGKGPQAGRNSERLTDESIS